MSSAKAQQLYRDFLAKAGGEGSRGGKVVGHSASGKPRYQSRGGKGVIGTTASGQKITTAQGHPHPYLEVRGNHENPEHVAQWGHHLASAFPKWSAHDHHEAAAAHEGQRQKLLKQDRWGEAHASELASLGHAHAAKLVSKK